MSFISNLFNKKTDEEKAAAKSTQKLTDDLEKCRKKLKEIADDCVFECDKLNFNDENIATIDNSQIIIKKQRTMLSDKPYTYDEFIKKIELEFELNTYKTKFIEVLKKYIADIVEYYVKCSTIKNTRTQRGRNMGYSFNECKSEFRDIILEIRNFPELMCNMFNNDITRINDTNHIFDDEKFKNKSILNNELKKFKGILNENADKIYNHLPLVKARYHDRLKAQIERYNANMKDLDDKINLFNRYVEIWNKYYLSVKPFFETHTININDYDELLYKQIKTYAYDKYLKELNDTQTSTEQSGASGGSEGDFTHIIQMVVLLVIILAILLLIYIILVETGIIETDNMRKKSLSITT
jgi:hypothetical protein